MRVWQSVLALLICAIPAVVEADFIEPSHSCSKPYKPYQFTSQSEVDMFNSDVQRYKRCIMDFVSEQREQAAHHHAAANAAIEEWNRFVRIELN